MTTNYDPGIVDARIRVRPGASSTGFTTWEDELGLDRWRTGDVFGESELPVLFAHGQHNRPDSIVLATTEYRRAYVGKLPHVLARLMDGHLVWIGFSFADQRIAAVLREIADHTGTRIDPGGAPRHVAVMAWDPDAEGNHPRVLARRAEIAYGAQLVLYPVPGGDHSALGRLLVGLTDDRFPPAADLPARAVAPPPAPQASPGIPVRWVPGPERVEHFTGRAEELARLDRWAADPQVALVGVTAWGALARPRWSPTGSRRPPGHRGVPACEVCSGGASTPTRRPSIGPRACWNGHGRSSGSRWPAGQRRRSLACCAGCRCCWCWTGWRGCRRARPGDGFGRLLDGTLREVLAGVCQQPARRAGAPDLPVPVRGSGDLRRRRARMLEVPPFTLAEGSALLAAAGGGWLPDTERRTWSRRWTGTRWPSGCWPGCWPTARPAATWPRCAPS